MQNYSATKEQTYETVAACGDEQLEALFDTTAFNNIMKGYLIAAAEDCGMDEETITRPLGSVNHVLDGIDAREANARYLNRKYS